MIGPFNKELMLSLYKIELNVPNDKGDNIISLEIVAPNISSAIETAELISGTVFEAIKKAKRMNILRVKDDIIAWNGFWSILKHKDDPVTEDGITS